MRIIWLLHWLTHFLWYQTIEDRGKTVYEQCVYCGKRRVWQRPGGAQPIDWQWIETGKFRGPPPLPKGGSSTGGRRR